MKSSLSVAMSVALLAGLAACTLVGTDPLRSSVQRDQALAISDLQGK